jgi:hypothetical protein
VRAEGVLGCGHGVLVGALPEGRAGYRNARDCGQNPTELRERDQGDQIPSLTMTTQL